MTANPVGTEYERALRDARDWLKRHKDPSECICMACAQSRVLLSANRVVEAVPALVTELKEICDATYIMTDEAAEALRVMAEALASLTKPGTGK